MPIDLDAIAGAAKAQYIRTGRQYGSQDTLEQAELTLRGFGLHGPSITPHGFGAADAAQLADARDLLVEWGVSREGARVAKKTTSLAFVEALGRGKHARETARAVLLASRRPLADVGNDAATQAIDAALDGTARAHGTDPVGLADQLAVLRTALERPDVAAAAAERGGPSSAAELDVAARALRATRAADVAPQGTPVETEKLDLIDGIIVTLTRLARRSARAAARRLGQPAIGEAFQLTALTRVARTPAKPARPADPING